MTDLDFMLLGKIFKLVRTGNNLTLRDVADRSKVSASTISRIERGEIDKAQVGNLNAIARALGCTLDVSLNLRKGE